MTRRDDDRPEPTIRIVEVTAADTFALLPPCADPAFDHRSCDYWEDADRGSKAIRLAWLRPAGSEPPSVEAPRAASANPFAPDRSEPAFNPFAAAGRPRPSNPFGPDDPADDAAYDARPENPFAPRPPARPTVDGDAPPKLRLLGRGLGIFGSYAKVLMNGSDPAAYAQFGPLSAYPRARRVRELYPRLPEAPLPAVITCIATTAAARGAGLAVRLVEDVCADLAGRGFAAVEAYPEVGLAPDATSAASPAFWIACGFVVAADDARYPVMRRELE